MPVLPASTAFMVKLYLPSLTNLDSLSIVLATLRSPVCLSTLTQAAGSLTL